jgi:membrane AbrB-like protein
MTLAWLQGNVVYLRTLMLTLAGGLVFTLFSLPIPWLLGPLVFNLAASLIGRRVSVPKALSQPNSILIGAYIGSRVSPEVLHEGVKWLPTLGLTIVLMAVSIPLITWYYRRMAKFDAATSFFSSIPGVLSSVLLFGTSANANVPMLTTVQCIRMASIVVVIPFLVQGYYGQPTLPLAEVEHTIISMFDLALLIGGCFLALAVFRWLKIPSSEVAIALLVSGVLFGSGAVSGELPFWLISLAFCVLGANVGSRFSSVDPKMLAKGGLQGVIATVLAVVISALFAIPASMIAGVEFMAAWLAFMPGGVGEMCLVAALYHLEPTYVVAHQLLRLLLLIITMSVAGWWFARPQKATV